MTDCHGCGHPHVGSHKSFADRKIFKIPFSCKVCGCIKINYQPSRDVLFVWPYPAPEKSTGGIVLVDEKYLGGSLKEKLRPPMAVILGIGKGYFNLKKGYFVPTRGLEVGDVIQFNKSVPWKIEIKNDDGIKYPVTLCGFQDVYGVYTQ